MTLALIAKFKKIIFPSESASNGKGSDDMNSSDKKETEPKRPTLKESGYAYKDGQVRLVDMQAAIKASGLVGTTTLFPDPSQVKQKANGR